MSDRSWDYELAAKLARMSGKSSGGPPILEGTVVRTNPLTVAFCDGEIMAPPMPLDCVKGAQGFHIDADGKVQLDAWAVDDAVVCCMMGNTAVILGKLGG